MDSQQKQELLSRISPTRLYKLEEILQLDLIPTIGSYTNLYNLVCVKRSQHKGKKLGYAKQLCPKVTRTDLKASHEGAPWRKIRGRILVLGSDIVLFLKLNGII